MRNRSPSCQSRDVVRELDAVRLPFPGSFPGVSFDQYNRKKLDAVLGKMPEKANNRGQKPRTDKLISLA